MSNIWAVMPVPLDTRQIRHLAREIITAMALRTRLSVSVAAVLSVPAEVTDQAAR
jgi:hypothetical protein